MPEPEEVLLRAVVQVPLQTTRFLVSARDDALA